MRIYVTVAFAVLLAGLIWLDGRAQTGDVVVRGAHRFEKVVDGVFYTTASGTMNVGANSPVIVTGDEALVIDSEITPAAARAPRRGCARCRRGARSAPRKDKWFRRPGR